MRLVNPTGTVNDRELGARAATNTSWPEALSGLKIGILSNSKPKVASLFDHLSVALHARGVETTCSLIKPGPTVPASTEQISELARSTEVVIAGVCDVGTATSWGCCSRIRPCSANGANVPTGHGNNFDLLLFLQFAPLPNHRTWTTFTRAAHTRCLSIVFLGAQDQATAGSRS